MAEIPAIGFSSQMSGVTQNLKRQESTTPESVFTQSHSEIVKSSPKKWLQPGSYDLKQFSCSTEYVNDEKRKVYTDMDGNKYVSVSGADLVLLDKVKSGNLFHKARYQMSISHEDYRKLTSGTVYEIDDKLTEKQFPSLKKELKTELKDYGFKSHPVKQGFGTINVNGETMLIQYKDSKVVVFRERSSNPSKHTDLEDLRFNNMEEFKTALKSQDYKWGQYQGIQDVNDYFIP